MLGFFDPVYLLFVGPAIMLGIIAQVMVRSTFAATSRQPVSSGVSGAQAARLILDRSGLPGVGIELGQGELSDHYDPTHRVLRLSPEVYQGRSLAAVGVAAHEAGHAVQQAVGYGPLQLRNGLVPLAATGGNLAMLFIVGGMVGMFIFGQLGYLALLIGIGLFSLTVLFQVVNLPVEFDASRRARLLLRDSGIVTPGELGPVGSVLNAAALTYVAATLTAVMTLLYYLYRAGLLGGNRD